jgi:hypothetical protein
LIAELLHDRNLCALVVQTALIACGIAVMALLTLSDGAPQTSNRAPCRGGTGRKIATSKTVEILVVSTL